MRADEWLQGGTRSLRDPLRMKGRFLGVVLNVEKHADAFSRADDNCYSRGVRDNENGLRKKKEERHRASGVLILPRRDAGQSGERSAKQEQFPKYEICEDQRGKDIKDDDDYPQGRVFPWSKDAPGPDDRLFSGSESRGCWRSGRGRRRLDGADRGTACGTRSGRHSKRLPALWALDHLAR